jgi:hypothetical protein
MVSVERVSDAVPAEGTAIPDLASCLTAYIETVKASTGEELQVDFGAGDNTPAPDDTTPDVTTAEVTGAITDIRTAVVDGNSIYYIKLDESELYFAISASKDANVVILNNGDTVKITYVVTEGAAIVNASSVTAQ